MTKWLLTLSFTIDTIKFSLSTLPILSLTICNANIYFFPLKYKYFFLTLYFERQFFCIKKSWMFSLNNYLKKLKSEKFVLVEKIMFPFLFCNWEQCFLELQNFQGKKSKILKLLKVIKTKTKINYVWNTIKFQIIL